MTEIRSINATDCVHFLLKGTENQLSGLGPEKPAFGLLFKPLDLQTFRGLATESVKQRNQRSRGRKEA